MSKIIVGYTGLVGKTICESTSFDCYFNSKNIGDYLSLVKDGDELTLTCLPANKRSVDSNVRKDIDNINSIIDIVSKRKYSSVNLISTIDVYSKSPTESDETYMPNIKKLDYGCNRYIFELMAKEFIQSLDFRIFRLGALFNRNITKNILFDLLNNKNWDINTNSRYQWYNLDKLCGDMEIYSKKFPNVMSDGSHQTFNLFTEPIDTKDILDLFPNNNSNLVSLNRIDYNYKTIFSESTGYGDPGYISTKEEVMKEIKTFISTYDNN